MNDFNEAVQRHQIGWRGRHLEYSERGKHKGTRYPWILPEPKWEDGLWPDIRQASPNSVQSYIDEANVQKHDDVHNLKSSWVLCANLYFAHRRDPSLLARFLADRVDRRIVRVERVELEWAEPAPLDPPTLLGEPKGQRGKYQTSPDLAFIVSMKGGGRGLVLTEVKYTERSYGSCSGRKPRYHNPAPERCLSAQEVFDSPETQCHLLNWDRERRRYWDYIRISDLGRQNLKHCPAATAGYQLFRQQALAEGIARTREYDMVVSTVAYDFRNETLIQSMRNTGIDDFAKDWSSLFDGRARFVSFTHQDWVAWVGENDSDARWHEWLAWVSERYAF